MARTAEAAALTERHRQAQLAVRAGALRDYGLLWPVWTGDEESFQRLLLAALPLVRAYHRLSSSVAATYFTAFRDAERAGGDATPRVADPLPDSQVLGTLHVTGIDMTRRALLAGAAPEAAMRTALVRTSGTVTRLTLQGGRDTVIRSVGGDGRAQGWARVTSGRPCAFCAMLASRGPVYSADAADFEAHDHCSCGAEPVYPGSEWPGRAREFRDLYEQHAAGTANPVNELRRVLEGRA